jgi:tetratricopeptide (TPR) repeat protein
VNLGDLRSTQGCYEAALAAYAKAAPLLQAESQFSAIADLSLMVAVTMRRMGDHGSSLAAYREAIRGHADLGMLTRVAYERVLFAEALMQVGRLREAEWQILAALPTIDEQKMVPEGFVAVNLLRESIRLRKTDSKALAELREYLQTKN